MIFVGRLVDWKAVDITLKALKLARQSGLDVRLEIVGDGPAESSLKSLAVDLGIKEWVAFHGFQPQSKCAEHMARTDALILNSLYECGGAVVLEAMSLGLPVIASDWGGPADYLDPSCGILVNPVPRESFAQRLADAILCLAQDPELSRRLGVAGAEKVRAEFDWEEKVARMLSIYEEVIDDFHP